MTRGKSGAPGFFTMGAPLLLTALLVLMFVTFSLLRLQGAREELRRAEQLTARNEAYDNACNEAQRVIAALCAGELPDVPIEEGEDTLTFRVTVTPTQHLTVTLRREPDTYRVLAWTVENE